MGRRGDDDVRAAHNDHDYRRDNDNHDSHNNGHDRSIKLNSRIKKPPDGGF